jgi:hypothetical protein
MSMPTEHHAERVQEKADAVGAIENTLATIEGQRREPDLWEREFLRQAIGWLFRGGYRSAAVNAELALTPHNQRSPLTNIRPDPLLDRCDIALLRSAFQESTAQPVREFPHLGPIHFEPNRR